MDNLTMDCIAAQKAGMSYGKWKALHPTTLVDIPIKVKSPCRICGGEMPEDARKGTLYCGPKCVAEADNRRHKERYRIKKERMMADG